MTTGQALEGEHVVLEPIEPDHVVGLRRILATPEVRSRWGDEAASPGWPYEEGPEVRFAIVFDGEVRGMIQYGEEDSPGYRHASAIRCYESVGFHSVGIMREYEHDVDGNGWHDALLMDLLAAEFD